MNALPNVEPHDAAWLGAASNVPVAEGGDPNPLNEPARPVLVVPNKTDIATHKVSFTFFPNQYASSLTVRSMTLPELRDLILTTKGKTKGDLPWLKGARFGNKKTPPDPTTGTGGGSLRWDDNVIGFDAIELDYDQEKMSIDEAIATIKAMNVRALIYTTPSHTQEAPR